MRGCPFCDIAHRRAPVDDLCRHEDDTISFQPLNPITEGHTLVVPEAHIIHAQDSPIVAGRTMAIASRLARQFDACNLITSCGEEASQTVRHLHIHIVPRRAGDGLALPWTARERGLGPCRGRCEFHGKLWCQETGGSCAEFIRQVETRTPPLTPGSDRGES